MQGMLAPETVEDVVGNIEVREIFRASKIGVIAGCMVTDGKVTRGAKVRLIRDGAVVHDGEIGSLRRFNEDVREVLCGLRVRRRAGQLRQRASRATRWRSTRQRQVERTLAVSGPLTDERAYVVLMRVHLFFPESGSLKGKRAELNRVKALLRERLHTSVAEVGHQDSWQRSTLAVAIAARSAALAQDTVDTVQRALDGRFPQGVRIEYRLASWDDLESLG